MLDENANIAPVSGVVIAGAIGFIFVLWLLNATQGRGLLARFIPTRPAEQTMKTKEEILASLSAQSNGASIKEEDKLRVLKSLAERIDNGEERITLSEEDKLKVLASLQHAQ